MSVVPVLSSAEAEEWDRLSREFAKIPSRVLMESAGRAVAAAVAREFTSRLPLGVLVACGTGNNGGDGYVAARALAAQGVSVTAATLPGDPSPDCLENKILATMHGVHVIEVGDEWGGCGVAVDALLGTGARGAPRGPAAGAIERLMRLAAPVVAVDGPSGLDLSTGVVHAPCVRSSVTVTFGGLRRGHLLQRSVCGSVLVADIGFPPPDPSWPSMVTDGWLREVLPPFTAEMHKGDRGRVVIVGGSEGMAGAVIFAAKATARSGAGLVKIAAAEATVRAAQANNPDLMTVTTALEPPLQEPLLEALRWADVVVLGPGFGRGATRDRFARDVLGAARGAVLVDADGLVAFRGAAAELATLLAGRHALLTPHRGEFAALFPDLAERTRHDPFGAAAEAASRVGVGVLLKGVPTVVASPGVPPLVSASGNPGLATGGTGDVLSGMAASWLARGAPPQIAGAAAAHVHGRAAENLAQHRSVRTLRPDDLLAVLSPLWRELAEKDARVDPPFIARLEPPAVH
ncbi:MAG TPA: NAD(P)H-hydrate dehydratase [Gemmatimonadales bacterium]|nr:NAD(P)H-hydrate dehydratase [Gemmatimonadales bacterium]